MLEIDVEKVKITAVRNIMTVELDDIRGCEVDQLISTFKIDEDWCINNIPNFKDKMAVKVDLVEVLSYYTAEQILEYIDDVDIIAKAREINLKEIAKL